MTRETSPRNDKNLLLLLLLAGLTIGVYSVTLANGFVWDDDYIIVNNPATRTLSGISDLVFSPDVVKPYYRPLNRASYLLDYRLFGMNPMGFHAVNLLIHLGNVLLFFLLGQRLFNDHRPAFLAAVVFAVHPVNCEAVNFISGRNNLLSLFFVLAAFLLFLRAKEGAGWSWLALSATAFFCGLLSKETSLVLIAFIALYSWYPPSGTGRGEWRGKLAALLPYLGCTALYLLLRHQALGGMVGSSAITDGLPQRLLHNLYIIPRYLALILFPGDLTIFHELPKTGLSALPWLFPAWGAILVTLWLLLRKKSAVVLFGVLWAAFSYLPIANIVPIPSFPMAERYLYFPALGLWLIAGECAWRFSAPGVRYEKVKRTVVGVIVIVLAGVTVTRSLDWKDDVSLFKSAIRAAPLSPRGYYNLGCAYQTLGNLTAAQWEWELALRVDPGYADALAQMGTLAAVRGDLGLAERDYLAALRAKPKSPMVHYNLGMLYEEKGETDRALEQYELFLADVPIEYGAYVPEAERKMALLRAKAPSGVKPQQ
jgi:protein O-mannosyl-transferase